MKSVYAAAAVLALATGAQAATVASGSTQVGDANGIDAQGAAVSNASNNAAYDNSATAIASDWVWVGNIISVDAVVFEFQFDMTGFDLATAVVSGLWGVDNFGSISLNGNEIASLSGNVASHYASLQSYGTSTASYFNQGANTLTYAMFDGGGPGAFRATVEVSADAGTTSPVPLPAGGLLLITALGGLALRRKRAD